MRRFAALTALALLATAAAAQPGRWVPRPIPNATEPSEVIANAPAAAWRPIAARTSSSWSCRKGAA